MLSVAIIARDEARHIGAAIESVAGLAGEVLVLLDDRTRDGSAAISRERGARVLSEPWRGFPAQRNRALELCQGEWVLFLDADERVTPALTAEIQTLLGQEAATDTNEQSMEDREWRIDAQSSILHSRSSNIAGYWIPRYNQFFGRVLRGGGWNSAIGSARSAFRYRLPPDVGDNFIGFRLARVLKSLSSKP